MSEILVPKYIEGQIERPPIGIAGYFKWELVRAGKVIKDSGGFHKNLIVNNGMDGLASKPFDWLSFAKVGTDATAPTNVDAGCLAPVGSFVGRDSVGPATYTAGPPDFYYRRVVFKWLEPNGNGNLTEIAIHWVDDNSCVCRQLLKDALGSPTVVTKTNLDQLFITYEYRVYLPQVDVATVTVISGVNYDTTARPCNAGGASWGNLLTNGPGAYAQLRVTSGEPSALVSRIASPNVGDAFTSDGSDFTLTAYVTGNFYVENKMVWDIGVANYPTGIGVLSLNHNGGINPASATYQFVFPTIKIPKTNTKKLTLFFRRSWARYP